MTRIVCLIASLFLIASASTAFAAVPEIGNIACETTTTTGTGTVSLSGTAADGSVTLISSGITSGATVPYRIENSDGDLEVGMGVLTDASPDTLTRSPTLTTNDTSAPITALTLSGTSTVCISPTAELLRRPHRVGELFWWGDGTCPASTLEADGSAISRTTYDELFDIISTTFGTGDGSTTYNLPDLSTDARFIRNGATVGTTQTDDNAPHNHSATDNFMGHANVNVSASGANHKTNVTTTDTSSSTGGEFEPDNIDFNACMVYQ